MFQVLKMHSKDMHIKNQLSSKFKILENLILSWVDYMKYLNYNYELPSINNVKYTCIILIDIT